MDPGTHTLFLYFSFTSLPPHYLSHPYGSPLYTMSESLSLHFAMILWFVFVFVEPPAAPNAADEDACPP